MTDVALTADARARAERIRVGIHSFIATRKEIADAYRDRDWATLGYESWEQYVDGEFSETRVRLTADERREAVAELRFAGMSQRAIGTALGVDQKTVSNDLRALATEENSSVGPERIVSLDGRERPATRPAAVPAEVAVPAEDAVPELSADERERLAVDVLSVLTDSDSPYGMTVAEIWCRLSVRVHSATVGPLLYELAREKRVFIASGTGTATRWAYNKVWVAPEDHPAAKGEGRSAGLTSAAVTADASDGSVVDPGAADELPARACEACGGPVDQDAIAAGFLRCEACDEDGDHVDRDGVCMGCNPSPDEDEQESAPVRDPMFSPEQRRQIEADAERDRSIANARKKAVRLLPEVSGFITEIVSGVRYGGTGLITAEMVAGLHAEADRLEKWMEESK